MLFLGGLYFLLIVFLFLYLPGRFLLRVTQFPLTDPVIRGPLEIGIGSTFFIAAVYSLSWIHAEFLYLFLLLPVIFLELKQLSQDYKSLRIAFPLFETALIIVGSCVALYITGRSGLKINGELFFYGVNATDAIFHISLIGNLMHHFPPTHAGLAGVSLHGYNFFYDLFVASFAKFFFLDPLDLFFRYFSLFVALLYGFSALALARFLKMDATTTRILLFLSYFAQGMTFLFTYFKIFYDPGVVQPIANMVDPSVLFSVSLFFLSYILLFSLKSWKHVVILAVLMGVIPMIKIYTAFLLFLALGCVTLYALILQKKERFLYLSLCLSTVGIAGAFYLPINFGIGKLVFSPFLLYTHFIESYSLANNSDYFGRMLVYFEHKNYLRILQKYIFILALFFIPSLSLRLFSLVHLPKLLRKSFYSMERLFWITAIGFGFLIPSLFIQNIAVFVVIQFLWIAYILLLIPTSYGLATLFTRSSLPLKGFLLAFIVLISLPDTVTLMTSYSKHPVKISRSLVAIADEIRKSVPQAEGLVVLNHYKKEGKVVSDYAVPIVSALSHHDVYYEPEVLEFAGLDHEITRRKNMVVELYEAIHRCGNDDDRQAILDLLHRMKSTYILTENDKACLTTLPQIVLVSQKGEAALYKIR